MTQSALKGQMRKRKHSVSQSVSLKSTETIERITTMVVVTEFQKVGIGLVGFALFFLLFGVLLYFDSVLLAFGNVSSFQLDTFSDPIGGSVQNMFHSSLCLQILFLTGLTFIIGFKRTFHFFFQRHKFRGSFFFLGGVSLVLCRWPIIGMLVEGYGFVLLFRSFFPMALAFVLSVVNIPFLNAFLQSGSSMV
ncbi:vesicle transport protein GOT1A isoform X1 [Syngnathus typhle]|uniref:vesicle transport protein GOT1A isoform X1 n=1 Tax=Syngnathus typhle TaxID=161592 RepID=UPI002A6A5F1B|nr:vesicle transport protein GOT1A isoform X1 [Syngnathus typhle]